MKYLFNIYLTSSSSWHQMGGVTRFQLFLWTNGVSHFACKGNTSLPCKFRDKVVSCFSVTQVTACRQWAHNLYTVPFHLLGFKVPVYIHPDIHRRHSYAKRLVWQRVKQIPEEIILWCPHLSATCKRLLSHSLLMNQTDLSDSLNKFVPCPPCSPQ